MSYAKGRRAALMKLGAPWDLVDPAEFVPEYGGLQSREDNRLLSRISRGTLEDTRPAHYGAGGDTGALSRRLNRAAPPGGPLALRPQGPAIPPGGGFELHPGYATNPRLLLGPAQERGLALRGSAELGNVRQPMAWRAPEEVPAHSLPPRERVINVQAVREPRVQRPVAQQVPRAPAAAPTAPQVQAARPAAAPMRAATPTPGAPAVAPRTGSFGRNLAIGGGLLGLGALGLGYGAYRMANRGDDNR